MPTHHLGQNMHCTARASDVCCAGCAVHGMSDRCCRLPVGFHASSMCVVVLVCARGRRWYMSDGVHTKVQCGNCTNRTIASQAVLLQHCIEYICYCWHGMTRLLM